MPLGTEMKGMEQMAYDSARHDKGPPRSGWIGSNGLQHSHLVLGMLCIDRTGLGVDALLADIVDMLHGSLPSLYHGLVLRVKPGRLRNVFLSHGEWCFPCRILCVEGGKE